MIDPENASDELDAAVVEVLTMAGYRIPLVGVISGVDVPVEPGVRVPAGPDW
jgi:hypothetical protein